MSRQSFKEWKEKTKGSTPDIPHDGEANISDEVINEYSFAKWQKEKEEERKFEQREEPTKEDMEVVEALFAETFDENHPAIKRLSDKQIKTFHEWKSEVEQLEEISAKHVGAAAAAGVAAAGATTASGAIAGAAAAAAAMYAISALTTTLVRNRHAITMKYGDKWGLTMRSVVAETYYNSLKSLVIKKDLDMKVTRNGQTIIIQSLYSLPRRPAARITLSVTEEALVVVPENSGASGNLEKIGFANGVIDVSASKSKGVKGVKFKDSDDIAKMWDSEGLIGSGYKIPKRKLRYQTDMVLVWKILVDIISEIYADYSMYFYDKVKEMQTSKSFDSMAFTRLMQKYDLEQATKRDAEAAKATELKKQELLKKATDKINKKFGN